jgi:hypothetical protein
MIRQLLYLGLILTICGCSGSDPTATDPQLIFKDGFENPFDQVTLLDEGGTMVRGFSAWLKMASELAELRPRRSSEYEYVDCKKPAEWFHQATADEALLMNQGALICQGFTDNRFDFDNGRWLVTDKSRGIIYYRVWKQSHEF